MLEAKNIGPLQEQHEYFTSPDRKRTRRCQYDYRDASGELFSCVRPTLELCRAERDKWLEANKRG